MNPTLIDQLKQLGIELGINGLPYRFPVHPNLVHLSLGLFIIGIIFDFLGTFFKLDHPIFKFLVIPTTRENLYDVAWYNVLASTVISFFTVLFGFFEILLANPATNVKSSWGLEAGPTMLLHGIGGVLLLIMMAAMTVWRGFQRYSWRKNNIHQAKWSYLLIGVFIMGYMFVHGTLGAQLGAEFGVHSTAANLIQQGQNPNQILN